MKQFVFDNTIDTKHIDFGSTRISVSYLFKLLDFNPLGIGRGDFNIDEAFTLKVQYIFTKDCFDKTGEINEILIDKIMILTMIRYSSN